MINHVRIKGRKDHFDALFMPRLWKLILNKSLHLCFHSNFLWKRKLREVPVWTALCELMPKPITSRDSPTNVLVTAASFLMYRFITPLQAFSNWPECKWR